MTKLSVYKTLFKLAKTYKSSFINNYLCIFTQSIMQMFFPIIIGVLIDEVYHFSNLKMFLPIVSLYGVLYITMNILIFHKMICWQYIRNTYLIDLQNKLYQNAIRAKATYLSNLKTGDLISRIEQDIEEFLNIITRNLMGAGNAFFEFIFAIIFISLINLQMAILFIIAVPLTIIISKYIGNIIEDLNREKRAEYGKYVSWLFELLKGIKEIRLFSSEKIATRIFGQRNIKLIRLNIKKDQTIFLFGKINRLVYQVAELCMYILAAHLAFNNKLTVGAFIAIVQYFKYARESWQYVLDQYVSFTESKASIERVVEILENDVEKDSDHAKAIDICRGDIVYEEISFGYTSDNQVLHNINLSIKDGETIALVGRSGVGKSTLAYLLIKFYQPQQGKIYIDGHNLDEFTYKSLRKQIGIIQQEIIMFNGTIRFNLTLGSDIPDEQIFAACEKAQIKDFILSLPDGLDTVIGYQNKELSGGQKQRIAIARILLKNPKILIFDEATSALDNITETKLQMAFEELKKGRTTILIAHRLSSIVKSDRVIVLKDGSILADGYHRDLLDTCEEYQVLFKEQYINEGII